MRPDRLAACLALVALPAAAQAQTPIAFQLNWLPQGEHCGFYEAQAAGLYAEAGLDVTLLPGGPEVNTSLLVAGGRVDLGMGSSFSQMNLLTGGIDGVTVAAFFQKSPQTLVAHPGQGVASLDDLADRQIMVANFSREEFWQFLKAEHGFRDDQLEPYAYSSAPFLADTSAVQQGYVTEDAYLLGAELPAPPVSILLADYGWSDYATTVFGMRDWIEANREAVAAFLAATAEGYRRCLDGTATAGEAAILAANPDHGEGLLDFKLQQMRDLALVTGDGTLPIGAMTAERWTAFADSMIAAGLVPAGFDISPGYDVSFFST
jgi:NitT/TauT family transport system substrate-binding protein